MKIDIGPYPRWFGPYQLAGLLKYVGVPEHIRDKIGDLIPAAPFLWLESLKKRKVKIKIDRYDAWSAYHTLALVIAPVLKEVKASKKGIPGSMLGDEYNALTSSKEYWEEKDGGPLHLRERVLFEAGERRWDEALDHMIWAFEQFTNDEWDEQFWTGDAGEMVSTPTGKLYPNPITGKMEDTYTITFTGERKCDWEGREAHYQKMLDGVALFAKHYNDLWT